MIIAILAGLAVILLIIRWLMRADPAVLVAAFKRVFLISAILLGGLLIFTGRISFLAPLALACLPMILPRILTYFDQNQGTTSSKMTIDEAYEILDLQAGATKSQINAAHKKLIKLNHPDTGGSTYLAQKLNEAKDLLIGSLNDNSK